MLAPQAEKDRIRDAAWTCSSMWRRSEALPLTLAPCARNLRKVCPRGAMRCRACRNKPRPPLRVRFVSLPLTSPSWDSCPALLWSDAILASRALRCGYLWLSFPEVPAASMHALCAKARPHGAAQVLTAEISLQQKERLWVCRSRAVQVPAVTPSVCITGVGGSKLHPHTVQRGA